MKKFSPCYKGGIDCPKRQKNCHATCPDYALYDEDNKLRNLTARIDSDIIDYTIRTIMKKRRGKNEKNRT